MLRFWVISLLLIFSSAVVTAQSKIGFGVSGLYHFEVNSTGVGARMLILVRKNVYAVPYGSYYTSGGLAGTYSGGVTGQYNLLSYSSITVYGCVSGIFRATLSASVDETDASASKSLEAEGELGAGVWFGSGCLKPFIEPRYQVVNEEVILRVGLVYFPGCKGSGGKSTGKGKSSSRGGGTVKWKGSKRKIPCPAYS